MAKVGEGDPRWIVTNREDGANVNNWHWTESDLSPWARNRLRELVEGLTLESDKMTAKTTDMTLEGEVSVNTRKQKTFLFYELNFTLKWQGTYTSSNTEGKGQIKVPYISEENADDDFEVQVIVDEESKSQDLSLLKSEVRNKIIPILKEKIPQMLNEMREASLKKTKLAPKAEPSAKLLDKVAPIVFKENPEVKKTTTSISTGASFTMTEKFQCSPRDMWESILVVNRVRAYAGGDAMISPDIGAKFRLFGGSVEGEVKELLPYSRIVQKWRFSSWPQNVYSTVVIEMEEKNGKTILKLEQSGIPSDDKDRTESGWRDNFFRRIRGVFGFGGI